MKCDITNAVTIFFSLSSHNVCGYRENDSLSSKSQGLEIFILMQKWMKEQVHAVSLNLSCWSCSTWYK